MEDLLQEYNNSIPNVIQLKEKIKKKLKDYEKKVEETKKQQHEPKVPDEDGWITVRHKGGRDPTKKLAFKERLKKKVKKEQKLLNFYSFEIKESKLKRHEELLAKFEEDKKRLAKMRGERKFKI